jgi:type II secretory pathway pseudopilin PulG
MKTQRGFSLFELALVVASLGLTILVGASGMVGAMKNAHQKKSILNIRHMARAMASYQNQYAGYPGSYFDGDPSVTWPAITDNLGQPVVVPKIKTHVPAHDGWGTPYEFKSGPDYGPIGPTPDLNQALHFVLYSLGSDGVPNAESDGSSPGPAIAQIWCQNPPVAVGTLHTHCYQSDIVWGDSSFMQAPDGPQKNCQ